MSEPASPDVPAAPPLLREETIRRAALRGTLFAVGSALAGLLQALWFVMVVGVPARDIIFYAVVGSFGWGLASAAVSLVEERARDRGHPPLRALFPAWVVGAAAGLVASLSAAYTRGVLTSGSLEGGIQGLSDTLTRELGDLGLQAAMAAASALLFGVVVMGRLAGWGVVKQAAAAFAVSFPAMLLALFVVSSLILGYGMSIGWAVGIGFWDAATSAALLAGSWALADRIDRHLAVP